MKISELLNELNENDLLTINFLNDKQMSLSTIVGEDKLENKILDMEISSKRVEKCINNLAIVYV